MGQMMNLFFDFDKASVYDIREVNSSFASGSLKVLYLGENRNGSYFSRAAVERALPSLKNVPIVCHWDRDANEIGGHDMEVVMNDSGDLSLRNLTEPCGVVPDHASFRFSVEADENGDEHEYLIIDGVLLWKRQDVYKHIVNDLDGKVKHSMEITVFSGESNDRGIYEINNFEFTALCLLERCDPCFQGSELNVYSLNHFKAQMEQMMSELKEYYTVSATSETDELNNSQEGGENVLDNSEEMNVEIEEQTAEFSVDETEIEVDQVEENANDAQAEVADEEPAIEESNEPQEYALLSGVTDELCRAVKELGVVEKEWGTYPRYWYADCDTEAGEVYCWDTNDWKLYGFNFTVNGDVVSVDVNTKKRMKYAIVPFEGEDEQVAIAQAFEQITANVESITASFNEVSQKATQMEAELDALRAYKLDNETKQFNAAVETLFSSFADLNGEEAFEALKENASKYDIETLSEKLYAIRGRMASAAITEYALKNSNKLVVSAPGRGANDNHGEPYGGLIDKYLNK